MASNNPVTPDAPSGTPQTRVAMDEKSSLCTTGFTPNILTGFFVRSLREHFSSPDNLEFGGRNEFRIVDGQEVLVKELERYIWSADITSTGILIDPVWKYNRQNIQQRPGILVKRNQFSTQKAAIGDGMTIGAKRDKLGAVQQVRGRFQTRAIMGSHSIFCIAGSAAEAELLGAEVFNHFLQFAQVIRQELNMHMFDAKSVEPVAYLEEFDDHFVVPVVLTYVYYAAWRIDVVAPWLKSLAIDVTAT